MSDLERVFDNAQVMVNLGDTVEAVLRYLRSKGVTKGETTVFLVNRIGVDDDVAIKMVHASEAWSDRRAADGALSRSLVDIVTSVGKREPDGSINLTTWLRTPEK